MWARILSSTLPRIPRLRMVAAITKLSWPLSTPTARLVEFWCLSSLSSLNALESNSQRTNCRMHSRTTAWCKSSRNTCKTRAFNFATKRRTTSFSTKRCPWLAKTELEPWPTRLLRAATPCRTSNMRTS